MKIQNTLIKLFMGSHSYLDRLLSPRMEMERRMSSAEWRWGEVLCTLCIINSRHLEIKQHHSKCKLKLVTCHVWSGTDLVAEAGSIPLRNWILLLIPSPIPELELALLSPGGIGIELELPSFELELESELRSSELNSELPSWNLNPIYISGLLQ